MEQVSLPAVLIERAESQAAQQGFDSMADYLADLVEQDANPFAGQEDYVEEAILEGLASGPAVPMTEERWQELFDGLDKPQPSEANS